MNGRAKKGKGSKNKHLVPDVRDQIRLIEDFLNASLPDGSGRAGDAQCGVYAFYDFDGAAIYVGQTSEQLRVRIRRHLTNRRTDAVAMKVLDPMEVAEVEVWPFWNLVRQPGESSAAFKARVTPTLDAAEWTAYHTLRSKQGAIIDILNEKLPPRSSQIVLPASYRGSIVPEDAKERLYHPDERISRRAETIAALAQIIKERDVSLGLRNTLVVQADRLHRLAKARYEDVVGDTPADEVARELTGHEGDSG